MRMFRKAGCFYILVDLLGVVTLGHCLATLPQKDAAQAEPGVATESDNAPAVAPDPGALPTSVSDAAMRSSAKAEHATGSADDARALGDGPRWGLSPSELAAGYDLGEARTLRPCLGEVLAVRPVQEPVLGVPDGKAQAAFARTDTEPGGLFELLVRSEAPMHEVEQALEAQLGPSEPGHAEGVRRWQRGPSVTTVTTRGRHTVVRAFHEERERAYREARRHACAQEAP